MKLNMTGPQAVTLFNVTKETAIPSSAKATSYATPQAYYCADTSILKFFIKGKEYTFIDVEKVESERTKTAKLMLKQEDERGASCACIAKYEELKGELDELHDCVKDLKSRVHTMHSVIYAPIEAAFKDGISD